MALLLFNSLRPHVAATLTFLGATMFLPCIIGVDLPVLPALGKEEFASIGCLIGMLAYAMPQLRRARIGQGPEILIAGIVLGAAVTLMLNRDPLVIGAVVVEGTQPTEIIASSLAPVLQWGIPFIAGRALFRRGRDVRTLLLILVVAALIYSLLICIELRLSPQLHRWVYGFHQHQFSQTIRASGYRPMVFMRHGLHVSLFIALATMAALTLFRMRTSVYRLPAAPVAGYLGIILIACKSLGSLLYGLTMAPLLLFASPRVQSLVACGLAALILSYPILRAFDLLPVEAAVEFAEEQAGETRAKSFGGRLLNEHNVLERARERVWFGWFGSRRSMVRDLETGAPATTFDGYWIIALGAGGVVRFFFVFGMLLWPIFAAARALPSIHLRSNRALVGGLSLIVAISMFDLLPNSTVEGYMTLFSGALSGVVPGILAEERHARRGGPKKRRRRTGRGSTRADDEAQP